MASRLIPFALSCRAKSRHLLLLTERAWLTNNERFLPATAGLGMTESRALEYEQQPPDEAWNAVEVFKKK